MTSKIYYTKPSITAKEVAYAADAAEHGWGSKCYDYINRFERDYAAFMGTDYAIATSSCTGALHMGMAALGVGLGDEVILADINWIATVSPIVHLGASPIFVDILADSWCLDPAKVEAAITPKTKAIVATHIYGNLCDMTHLLEIGEKYGIPIIEDAAEAIGSQYNGKRAGAMGAFGSFSFHGTKTLTTGEGGMFVTSDPKLYERVLTLSNHGRSRTQTKQFWPDMVGFKYKMSNIQAAIGCGQLERIDELIAGKRKIFKAYKRHLQDLPLSFNPEPHGSVNGYWMPSIVPQAGIKFDRTELLEIFKQNDIDGRVFFHPLSSLDMFETRPENTLAFSLSANAVNLPSYHDLTETEILKVCDIIRTYVKSQN